VQARSHARAVTRVRPFKELRVAGRSREKAGALAAELAGELDLAIHAVASWEEACEGADVICATTHALEPVVRRKWLTPGAHETSVGYNVKGREVDDESVADSLVFVESRAAALAPAPSGSTDLLEPIERGLIDPDDITEIGELVEGSKPGRASPTQTTLYKSVGVAVQDATAAALVLRAARESGAGLEVEL
jgi:ornithine cyclodeaminase